MRNIWTCQTPNPKKNKILRKKLQLEEDIISDDVEDPVALLVPNEIFATLL